MRKPAPADQRMYRYKLRLTVDQTEVGQPSILVERHKLYEVDSWHSPEMGALADFSRDHVRMPERDRYVLAFALMTARQLLGQASRVSPEFREIQACLDNLAQEMKAGSL